MQEPIWAGEASPRLLAGQGMEGRRTEQKQFKVPALLWRETAWGGWVSGVTDLISMGAGLAGLDG